MRFDIWNEILRNEEQKKKESKLSEDKSTSLTKKHPKKLKGGGGLDMVEKMTDWKKKRQCLYAGTVPASKKLNAGTIKLYFPLAVPFCLFRL